MSSEKTPISMPKMPNGSAGPASRTHVPTKKVQAKDTTERNRTMMVKQSALTGA